MAKNNQNEPAAASEQKTTLEIANVLGTSVRTVQRYSQEGILPKLGNNSFDLSSTVQAYLRHRETEIRKEYEKEQSGQFNEDVEKARRLHFEASRSQLKYELEKSLAYDGEAIDYHIQKSIEASRAKILAMPNALAQTLADISNPEACRKVLDAACREMAEALADFDPEEVSGRTREIIDEEEAAELAEQGSEETPEE